MRPDRCIFQERRPHLGKAQIVRLDVAHHVLCGAEIRLFENGIAVRSLPLGDIGKKAALLFVDLVRFGAPQSLDRHADIVGRQLCHLLDLDNRADRADIVRRDLVLLGVLLHGHKQRHVPLGRARNGGQGNEPARIKGIHRLRKDHLSAKRDERIIVNLFFRHILISSLRLAAEACPPPHADSYAVFTVFRISPPARRQAKSADLPLRP